MRKPRLWVIVMNTHKARILHDLLEPHHPDHAETVLEGPDRKLRDVLRDRPGRSFASMGDGSRSAMEPGTDPLREDTLAFLRDVFDHLEKRHSAKEFDELALICPPDLLGLWREAVPDPLQGCMRHELTKNLLKLPEPELMPAVRALLEA